MDLARIDRRIIFALVFLALSIPLLLELSLPAPPIKSAKQFFELIERIEPQEGKFALVFMDFGPNSKAENFPQSEVAIEHLLRRRIPFAVISQYLQAEPLLESIPQGVIERLSREPEARSIKYGEDWVNLGYRVGGTIFIQGFAGAENLAAYLRKDARGNILSELPMFAKTKSLESVQLMAQFTSLVGTLDTLIQFFRTDAYRPPFAHGCTSITIPQAFIFLDSGQLEGLLEGIAGAGSYASLLAAKYPQRAPDRIGITTTGLGVAHAVIILLVILGNAGYFLSRRRANAA